MNTNPSPKDWPEDFSHENGNYQNKCIRCSEMFLGYKRRRICKECQSRPGETPDLMYFRDEVDVALEHLTLEERLELFRQAYPTTIDEAFGKDDPHHAS